MNVENLKELTFKKKAWNDVVEKGKTHVSAVKLMEEEEEEEEGEE